MIVIIFSFNFDNVFSIQNLTSSVILIKAIQNLTSSVILIKAVSSQSIDEDKDC